MTGQGQMPWPVQLVDALNEKLGLAVSWLTLLMVGVTFLGVVLVPMYNWATMVAEAIF